MQRDISKASQRIADVSQIIKITSSEKEDNKLLEKLEAIIEAQHKDFSNPDTTKEAKIQRDISKASQQLLLYLKILQKPPNISFFFFS